MRARRRVLLGTAFLLGAGVVVLPAAASSEAGPIEAVNSSGYYGEQHHSWSPSAATVSVGGVVKFANSTSVEHAVVWDSGPETPACNGVPSQGSTQWHGSCSFAKPGTYTFHCSVHPNEMKGTITVEPNGTTTTSTTTSTTQSTPPPLTTASPPPSTGEAGAPGPSAGGAVDSPLAGSASAAVKVAPTQRGSTVHGSVSVSTAGAGGRLEVRLLAPRGAGIASARHSPRVTVGRLLRSPLGAGPLAFTVKLDAGARRALHARRRLALGVRVTLTPPHGSVVSVNRSVLLRA